MDSQQYSYGVNDRQIQQQIPSFEQNQGAIQSMFTATNCYDLTQASRKVIVFESTISFQLAFYALIEHETEVGPIWDPERRTLAALMTVTDYIHGLVTCLQQGLPSADIMTKSIADVATSVVPFQHSEFNAIDAEDTVTQLFMSLQRLRADFVPIIDPDDGNVIAVLGYLDLAHLLDEAAKQHPQVFLETIESVISFRENITAPTSAKIIDVLKVLRDRNLAGIPVTSESGEVVGYYARSDTTFITKATDADGVMGNLLNLTVGDVLFIAQEINLQPVGDNYCRPHPLVKCALTDSVAAVVHAMMTSRVTMCVCVSETGSCLGTVSVQEIVQHYFKA